MGCCKTTFKSLLNCIIFLALLIWFGRAFHGVAADVPISRPPYRFVLLRLGTSDVVDADLRAQVEAYN